MRSKASLYQILHIWVDEELGKGVVEKYVWDTYYFINTMLVALQELSHSYLLIFFRLDIIIFIK